MFGTRYPPRPSSRHQSNPGNARQRGNAPEFRNRGSARCEPKSSGDTTVFDYGFHEDKPFTVFEYIEGQTLDEVIQQRKRIPVDELRLIVAPLAQALDYVHSHYIIHRDLKPANIRATAHGPFK